MNLEGYSLLSILKEIERGSINAEDVNDFYYKKSLQLNDKINAYITLLKPDDKKINGNLKGIALAIKDNISTKGIKTTCASKMLESYVPPYDATAVSKLKEQGGRILGKTNMDEFAMGSSGENSAFGPTRNPLNNDYVTGGSSSGSAAAVAANMAPISLGSDTGGSVRAPASFTGIVGFKPSYGAVSRYGLIAYANSLEVIGILGKYTKDVKFLFKLIAGKDPLDSTSLNVELNEKEQFKPKILVIKSFVELSKDEVKKEFYRSISKIDEEGFEVKFIDSFSLTEYLLSAYYTIACAEASTNLSRYDGIRYGPKVESTGNWRDYITKARSFFGPEVKARIMMGTFILSAGYYETYYLRALQLRKLIRQEFEKIVRGYDALYIPTMPVLPWRIGEAIEDPKMAYASDVLTVLPNLTGSPALSLPVGRIREFFVGGQLIGLRGDDIKVLKIAEMMEEILKVKNDGRN
ncbi:MAG: Asp-tRNA(Asn)/Glu-tRNA(Gln) amidotransferase subunit GatA [Nitrososphaeria archaeon]|nr:Asp-tRNA(Asn)/Glu-tRNA(Gln) amidotransferase subunit GatA [Conexivisphaerales archaeon]